MRSKISKKRLMILEVLCVMLVVMLVGCNKKTEAEITSEVLTLEEVAEVSETVSEVDSASEGGELSEEVSEETSEPASEIPEIVDGVQILHYKTYDELVLYFKTLDTSIIAIYSTGKIEEGQAILYDGAYYTLQESCVVTVKSPNVIKTVTSTAEYVYILDIDYEGEHEWNISVETTGTNIEVPLTITYEDGTEETFTVYITKDWKYPWEE